jgi:hypothetical protein
MYAALKRRSSTSPDPLLLYDHPALKRGSCTSPDPTFLAIYRSDEAPLFQQR